jgi:recombinational DNA repair ATPase RecF
MNGYQYLVQRNRLMHKLEQELAQLGHLTAAERQKETRRLEAEFDRRLAELYAQVAAEYPGERRKKARPLADPR